MRALSVCLELAIAAATAATLRADPTDFTGRLESGVLRGNSLSGGTLEIWTPAANGAD